MGSFQFSPNAFHFDSTFAAIPVVIEYEVDVSEDHRGQDVDIVPMTCVIGETGVDLCEDAALFHPEQLKTWLAEAKADYKSLGQGADDDPPDDYLPSDTLDYLAAAAEDRWIAFRDHVHSCRAGL